MHVHQSYYCIALAIFSRSPSAFQAVKSLGILNLPCDQTLKGYMYKHCSSPGINEKSIEESSMKYKHHVQEKVVSGHKKHFRKVF